MTLSAEFRAVLARRHSWEAGKGVPEPPDEATITRCIQVMMHRQCIYPDQRPVRRVYDILTWREYAKAFESHFAAMGYDLVHDARSGMLALNVRIDPDKRKRDGWTPGMRLKRDESMVLVCLRLTFEEGYRGHRIGDDGEIETDTDELVDKLRAIANIQPEARRLEEILLFLKGKGVVRLLDRDPEEKVRYLAILPGVEIACPGSFIQEVIEEARAVLVATSADEDADGDGEDLYEVDVPDEDAAGVEEED